MKNNSMKTKKRELYPYSPAHLLLRQEWDELFDTSPDLSGADLDISRFIRSGEERDVSVFWRDIEKKQEPDESIQASRKELCNVPFLAARDWLCEKKLEKRKKAWVWDYLDGKWKKATRSDLYPGQIVLVSSSSGGYAPETGWDENSSKTVTVVADSVSFAQDTSDRSQNNENLSEQEWQSISEHGKEVAEKAKVLSDEIASDYSELLYQAGIWHDWGKAHPAFQDSIRHENRPDKKDLAKAPNQAWSKRNLYRIGEEEHRPGFRHELASTLGIFALLRHFKPDHSALLGPWKETLEILGEFEMPEPASNNSTKEAEKLLQMDAEKLNLLMYLVASHHGKLRLQMNACPQDQDYRAKDDLGLPIRGIRKQDKLLGIKIGDDEHPLPELELMLEPAAMGLSKITGASWCERCLGLLKNYSPPALALLECLLRAADIRVSKGEGKDLK